MRNPLRGQLFVTHADVDMTRTGGPLIPKGTIGVILKVQRDGMVVDIPGFGRNRYFTSANFGSVPVEPSPSNWPGAKLPDILIGPVAATRIARPDGSTSFFTCHKCGGHAIEEVMTNVTVSSVINSIGEGGDIEYGLAYNDDGEVDRFQCVDCGATVTSGDNEELYEELCK
jgi:hypothetical protein